MNAREAALWVLNGEDNYVVFDNKVCKGPIYEEYNYIPVVKVGEYFYHICYEKGSPKVDYGTLPVYVDENFNIVE